MVYSKSIARLLQPPVAPPPDAVPWQEPQHPASPDLLARAKGAWIEGRWHPAMAHDSNPNAQCVSAIVSGDKGDRRTLVEAPKPNEEREVGDLERCERETHGRATGA